MSALQHVVPLSFLLDGELRRLQLSWSDGHESLYDWEALRRACPCAWCAGEGSIPGMVQAQTFLKKEETTLVNIEPVGRYGLTPVWSDGHHTGIFTYEKLRILCQCHSCSISQHAGIATHV